MSKLMIKGGTLVTMNAGRQILSADILIENMALVDLEKAHASPGIGRDPVSRLVYSATAGDVHTTIVNGKILMQDRKLETIDISDTINQANIWCEKIMKNAGVPSYFV